MKRMRTPELGGTEDTGERPEVTEKTNLAMVWAQKSRSLRTFPL